MSEGHIAEHCVGEDVPNWEHLKFYHIAVGDMGEWTIHIWTRMRQCRKEFKCTISPRRPFTWQQGYDTEYEAINGWMHIGCED